MKKRKWSQKALNVLDVGLSVPYYVASIGAKYDYKRLSGRRFRLRARANDQRIKTIFNQSALDDTRDSDLENAAFLAVMQGTPLWHGLSRVKKDELVNLFTTPAPDYRDMGLVTTYGIEEEFFGLSGGELGFVGHVMHRTASDWVLTEDSSIIPTDGTKGRELVSPILFDDNVQRLHSLSLMLEGLGAKVDLPCALHVHSGIKNTFSEARQVPIAKQIVLNYMALEGQLDGLKSDLVNPYASSPWFGDRYDEWLPSFLAAETISNVKRYANINGGRRCVKVNADPLSYMGTMEFREHPGTVSPAHILPWLTFINEVIRQAMIMTEGQAPHIPNEVEQQSLRDAAKTFREARGFAEPQSLETVFEKAEAHQAAMPQPLWKSLPSARSRRGTFIIC